MKNINSLKLSLVATALCACIGAQAQGTRATNVDGYLVDSYGHVVKSGTGLCVRTSSYNPATTFHPDCDTVAPERVVVPEAPRVPERAPEVVVAPQVVQKSLRAEVLFIFDSDKLTVEGKQKLDQLVKELGDLQNSRVDQVIVNGHTDPIGSDAYNQNLSERRARTVQRYLAASIGADLIKANGMGERELKVTTCGDRRTAKSISCNAPNRRVEVTIDANERR